jgi:hypothetical protein
MNKKYLMQMFNILSYKGNINLNTDIPFHPSQNGTIKKTNKKILVMMAGLVDTHPYTLMKIHLIHS